MKKFLICYQRNKFPINKLLAFQLLLSAVLEIILFPLRSIILNKAKALAYLGFSVISPCPFVSNVVGSAGGLGLLRGSVCYWETLTFASCKSCTGPWISLISCVVGGGPPDRHSTTGYLLYLDTTSASKALLFRSLNTEEGIQC